MADFSEAVRVTLGFEGSNYVNDPDDPGGATRYGITQKDLPGTDISSLSEQQAIAYYRQNYWKVPYGEINSQAVATKLFDQGVLSGVGTAIRLLQETLDVPVDGVFGPETLLATNEAGDALLDSYKQKLLNHYHDLVSVNPTLAKFWPGWYRRAMF